MANPKLPLALLLFYITSVSAVSLPVSLQAISTNNSFPNFLSPSPPPNLTAPSSPAGFFARLDFNSSVQLKPLQVYICTIETMSLLANLPWTFDLPGSVTMTGEGTQVEIFLDKFPPTAENSRLQIQYAILGLYKAGIAIAQGSQFYQLVVELYMNELKVGFFELRPSKMPLTFSYPNDTMVRADSGKIRDPENTKLFITYEWDGMRIKSQDIFTAILDSFAIAAAHSNRDLDAYIPAARSASGDTVFSTWVVGEEGNPRMTWARLKRMLILIWDLLIIAPEGHKSRFEGFVFRLNYDGKDIMAGRMLRFDARGDRRGLERS